MKLLYGKPATEFTEGIPVGTGRLAAMVLGSHKRERVALNHEWLWKGAHRHRDNENTASRLPEVRNLFLEGKYAEGTLLSNRYFGGGGGKSGKPSRVDPYQAAGDLYIEFNHGPVHDYRRELDLETGIARVSYISGNTRYNRTCIAHLPDDIILIRLDRDGEPFDCAVWLDRVFDPDCELSFDFTGKKLTMRGEIKTGVNFRVEAAVEAEGGESSAKGGKLFLKDVRSALIRIDMDVTADGEPLGRRKTPVKSRNSWEELLSSHISAHREKFHAVSFDLKLPEMPDTPIDERMAAFRSGCNDPGLFELYFHYGRYLFLSATANASLPPNLQGKWCEDLNPVWNSDYHSDINLQMCHWPAEPAGNPELLEPLFSFMESFIPHAKKAAADIYGCRGIFFPLQTDPWGKSTPESSGWAVWTGAAPWLARHFLERWEYVMDEKFLRERAYPFFREIALFYEDYLAEDDEGVLQLIPSQSPESSFEAGGDGELGNSEFIPEHMPVSLCVSSAMDITLARETFEFAVRASGILGLDREKREKWKSILERLPELKISGDGRLLEWNEDFTEKEPGHRHFSHLYGLYPGDSISKKTPELLKAAEKSLERRMANGSGQTGWSSAWAACLYARLGRGNDALKCLKRVIGEFSTDTLLGLHPPRIFQLDANLGAVAAVFEMLLQSRGGVLHFLPALPEEWPEGDVRGLKARGGFTVGMSWREGKLEEASIESSQDGECRIVCAADDFRITASGGGEVEVKESGGGIEFNVNRNMSYRVYLNNKNNSVNAINNKDFKYDERN